MWTNPVSEYGREEKISAALQGAIRILRRIFWVHWSFWARRSIRCELELYNTHEGRQDGDSNKELSISKLRRQELVLLEKRYIFACGADLTASERESCMIFTCMVVGKHIVFMPPTAPFYDRKASYPATWRNLEHGSSSNYK